MSDNISRQAAIDALRYAQHRFTVADEAGGMGTVKWSEYVIYFAEAERILTELSSAQPEKSTEKRTETHACDLISRQAAIDAIHGEFDECLVWDESGRHTADEVGKILDRLPAARSEQNPDEWCTDCKEYDKERHCCPRFNRVIRTALGEAQSEIVRCKDCKYGEQDDDGWWYCEDTGYMMGDGEKGNGFCSNAERRTDEQTDRR